MLTSTQRENLAEYERRYFSASMDPGPDGHGPGSADLFAERVAAQTGDVFLGLPERGWWRWLAWLQHRRSHNAALGYQFGCLWCPPLDDGE